MNQNYQKPKNHEDGFTLAELLIVIAIIGVLVAVSIPIFHKQLEKARRAVDMHTARSVESALVLAYNSGAIQLPEGKKSGTGAWVMFCSKGKRPEGYSQEIVCGTGGGLTIDGQPSSVNWNQDDKNLRRVLEEQGLDVSSLTVRSNGKDDGWDWIVVQVGYDNSLQLHTRFFSGFAGKTSSDVAAVNQYTNIEKQIYGDQKK